MALLAPTVPLVASLSISAGSCPACPARYPAPRSAEWDCAEISGMAIELRALKPVNGYPNRPKSCFCISRSSSIKAWTTSSIPVSAAKPRAAARGVASACGQPEMIC